LTPWHCRQVIDVDTSSNVAEVKVSEAVVNRVVLKYIDKKTNEVRDEGRTKPHIILRNLTTRPGQVFSLQQGRRDIDAIYSMGLFEDVSMRPQPAEGSSLEHPKVDLALEITERKTGGLSAGGGISASGAAADGALPGVVGEVSYSQRNLFGLGQRLVASAKLGQTDSMFRVQHTDPWVRGDAHRTSRTTTIQAGSPGGGGGAVEQRGRGCTAVPRLFWWRCLRPGAAGRLHQLRRYRLTVPAAHPCTPTPSPRPAERQGICRQHPRQGSGRRGGGTRGRAQRVRCRRLAGWLAPPPTLPPLAAPALDPPALPINPAPLPLCVPAAATRFMCRARWP
jgi:hypothetical protein